MAKPVTAENWPEIKKCLKLDGYSHVIKYIEKLLSDIKDADERARLMFINHLQLRDQKIAALDAQVLKLQKDVKEMELRLYHPESQKRRLREGGEL